MSLSLSNTRLFVKFIIILINLHFSLFLYTQYDLTSYRSFTSMNSKYAQLKDLACTKPNSKGTSLSITLYKPENNIIL